MAGGGGGERNRRKRRKEGGGEQNEGKKRKRKKTQLTTVNGIPGPDKEQAAPRSSALFQAAQMLLPTSFRVPSSSECPLPSQLGPRASIHHGFLMHNIHLLSFLIGCCFLRARKPNCVSQCLAIICKQ